MLSADHNGEAGQRTFARTAVVVGCVAGRSLLYLVPHQSGKRIMFAISIVRRVSVFKVRNPSVL